MSLIYRTGILILMMILASPLWVASQEETELLETAPLEIKSVDVTAEIPGNPSRRVRDYRGFDREYCVTCHDGLEPMSASHPAEFGCAVCHGGDGSAVDKIQAHTGLIFDPQSGTGKRNPSALSVVHLSCGQNGCHAGHADPSRNHVHRVRRSMMGTLSGVIAGLRYQWSAQSDPRAKFGVYPVPATQKSSADEVGTPMVESSAPELEPLPFFAPTGRTRAVETGQATGQEKVSRHLADSLLRSRCFQCHLDGSPVSGGYRSQGCAACHVTYDDDGLYKGLDPTIDKTDKGRMSRHRMTALPEQTTCTQCHQALASPKPATDSTELNLLPATGRPLINVHAKAGMECIDCHTSSDVMGDGTVYSRQHEAVEIQCETCHGDAENFPSVAQIEIEHDPVLRENTHYSGSNAKVGDWMALSRRGQKLSNVKVESKKIVVVTKRTGKKLTIPLIRGTKAHAIPQHSEKLACTSCHSAWVPECTGCHLTFNPAEKEKESWSPFRYDIKFQQPALMVGPDGKVRPTLPQPLRTVTVLDKKGTPVSVLNDEGDAKGDYRDFGFTNPLGYSGANLNFATHPHSVGSRVRSCASCHLSPQTLGLGHAQLSLGWKKSGKRDRVESTVRGNAFQHSGDPSALPKGTLKGQTVAGSSQPGARAFNQQELNRILKVGNCLPCHKRSSDPIYRNIEQSYRIATTSKHKRRIKQSRNKIR